MDFTSELILGPIVGGLGHDRANLWGRADQPKDDLLTLYAWIGSREDLSDASLVGQAPLIAESGFAGVVPVRGLEAETKYHYALTLSADPPMSGEGPLTRGVYPAFRTFPQPGEKTPFNFAFGSCFLPAGSSSGGIFRALEEQRTNDQLRFLLSIGDQIYADAYEHNGLGKVAQTLAEYRSVYQHTWSQPAFREMLWNLPAFMTLDDHEVDDDWRWRDPARTKPYIPWWDRLVRLWKRRSWAESSITHERVQAALQAYWEHQAIHAHTYIQSPSLDSLGCFSFQPESTGSFAYTFTYGAAAFFVLDTRTMRVRSTWKRNMLGGEQWDMLKDWFKEVDERFPVKFLVSSGSLLYSSWMDIPQDRWSGYAEERDQLLHFLANEGIQGVYVLSGDFHFGFAIQAVIYGPDGQNLPIYEFCASPFSQKPHRLASKTYREIRNGLFKKQEVVFTSQENNFGVVRVSFDTEGVPIVGFELFNQALESLGHAGDNRRVPQPGG